MKDWLFERVADDNDIVVDEMQEEFGDYYDKLEVEKIGYEDEWWNSLGEVHFSTSFGNNLFWKPFDFIAHIVTITFHENSVKTLWHYLLKLLIRKSQNNFITWLF